MTNVSDDIKPGILRVGGGDLLGAVEAVRDRFLLEGKDSGGRIAILQHLLPPRALAAPLHRHTREDEFSFVLEGRVGALLGDQDIIAEPGDLVSKPRGQWHTFWNAGDEPAVVLEIILPGGLEQAFREMHALGDGLDPEKMAAIASRYGCDTDFEATGGVIEKHALTF